VVDASGFIRIEVYNTAAKFSVWKSWREREHHNVKRTVTEVNFSQILCLIVSPNGKRFVTCGSDTVIGVYDLHSSANGQLLIPSRTDFTAAHILHTNRVTALADHPLGCKDPVIAQMFVFASWVGTVPVWGKRSRGSVWLHAGTNVAGADDLYIDRARNSVLTGSYKHDKPLSQVSSKYTSSGCLSGLGGTCPRSAGKAKIPRRPGKTSRFYSKRRYFTTNLGWHVLYNITIIAIRMINDLSVIWSSPLCDPLDWLYIGIYIPKYHLSCLLSTKIKLMRNCTFPFIS
ncbi:uncharacterized protein DEA37_0010952, partial [Paragonimus westermani]